MTQSPRAHAPVVTFGETMALIRATEIGSLAQVNELRLGIGGAEANVAIGLRRLGVPATWLGRVGADSLGTRVSRELHAEGVSAITIADPIHPTGLMLKERRHAGLLAVHYYRAGSAGSHLSARDLELLDIESAALVHITGITPALSESAQKATLAAAARAQAAGVPVSFDVNHRRRLWRDEEYVRVYAELVERATIVFAGVDEASLVTQSPLAATPRDLAEAIAQRGPSSVVIKLGPQGAVALDGREWHTQAATPISPVDTVGAGDAFAAGWIAEWHSGASPQERLATAALAGAWVCLHPGDWEGMPSRRDLGELTGRFEDVQR